MKSPSFACFLSIPAFGKSAVIGRREDSRHAHRDAAELAHFRSRPHFRPACTPDSYKVTNTWIKRKHLLPIYSNIL